MKSPTAAQLLLLSSTAATAVTALPEIAITKKRHSELHPARLRRRANGDGSVETNVYDVLTWSAGGAYYANVTVGTPPQNQVVILDTGSSDLYFDASTAPACNTEGPYSCRGGTFNPQNSNTYQVVDPAPAFNTSFGDGSSATGPFAQDTVNIGDVVLSNVQFGVAEEVNSTTGYAVGLMGVGYSLNEATYVNYPNMPEVLKDAGVINSRLYSVYLNDEGETSGTILFGGIDSSRFTGNLETFDLLPDEQTGFVFEFITTVTGLSASVGGKTQQLFSGGSPGVEAYQDSNSLPVLLDTGSSAWSVPQDVYDQAIAPVFNYVDQNGLCSCSYRDSSDSMTLTFAGSKQITVPAREFIVPLYNASTNAAYTDQRGDPICSFMVTPSSPTGQGFLTLGDAVLRSMYVVFDLDNGQISIAQAAVNSTQSANVHTVSAGPSGVAHAVSSASAAPSNTYSIAAEVNATASFAVTTAQSTLGEATGTAAVPFDAQIGASATGAAASGSKGGSGSGSSGPTSSAAAAGLVVPGVNWGGVYSVGIAIVMAAVGAGVML